MNEISAEQIEDKKTMQQGTKSTEQHIKTTPTMQHFYNKSSCLVTPQ